MSATIAAISTPPGVGGIAVVRLSGPDALAIAARHVRLPAQGRDTAFAIFRAGGSTVDEVVVTLFRAPHSYTGEDTVEFSCHGSVYIQQALLQALLDSGAVLAAPGEFTQWAFLNGKLDLSQVEAVADLINATNASAHQLALSQLRGGYVDMLASLRQQLVDLTALLELELDFSEEDVEFADRSQLRHLVDRLRIQVARLVESFRLGNAFKNGVPVAIVGPPNVGKSSLLNTLLADERAIVSPIPGTTRDTIEETLTIDGVTFRFIDTAGLRQTDDPIEAVGLRRSVTTMRQASVILFVHDLTDIGTATGTNDVEALLDGFPTGEKIILHIYNKADLVSPPYPDGIVISTHDGFGIDGLKDALVRAVRSSIPDTGGIMLSNLRHYEAFGKVAQALDEVAQGLGDGIAADLVAIDLRSALYHLGTITGHIASGEILGTIFQRFCIGK